MLDNAIPHHPLVDPQDAAHASISPIASSGASPLPLATAPKPKLNPKRFILRTCAIAALCVGAHYLWDWYVVGRFVVSTDDAYVRADVAVIAAKVSGYVTSVAVTDNQTVSPGQLLATIDGGDYRLAVDAAQSKIATQEATIARIRMQADAQRAVIEQTEAQLTSVRADEQRAASEFERSTRVMQNGAGTQQRLDLALADRDRTVAAVRNAQAAQLAAQANLGVLEAERVEAEQTRNELMIALEKSRRDLSFTEIRAPFAGVIGNRAIETGQLVQIGTRLLSIVPLESAYVEANFKETQITRMKPGQKVSIHIDALPGRAIEGTLESLSPASGAQFSLLPPENATGNFTKIVQRLPVRIHVPLALAAEGVLRPGLSVTADVDTWPADEQRPTLSSVLGLGAERPGL